MSHDMSSTVHTGLIHSIFVYQKLFFKEFWTHISWTFWFMIGEWNGWRSPVCDITDVNNSCDNRVYLTFRHFVLLCWHLNLLKKFLQYDSAYFIRPEESHQNWFHLLYLTIILDLQLMVDDLILDVPVFDTKRLLILIVPVFDLPARLLMQKPSEVSKSERSEKSRFPKTSKTGFCPQKTNLSKHLRYETLHRSI